MNHWKLSWKDARFAASVGWPTLVEAIWFSGIQTHPALALFNAHIVESVWQSISSREMKI